MSRKHPIVAVTGSSGAGTSTVKRALEHIFERIGSHAAFVAGDSFHRYNRIEMKEELAKAKEDGRNLSHFGPEGNLFDKQLELSARAMADPARGSAGTISTTRPRQHVLDISPGLLPPGKRSSRTPICSSTRDCTAAWWRGKSTWPRR